MLKGREATAIRGLMTFDLDAYGWLAENEDTRALGFDIWDSPFNEAMGNEAHKRRAALHRVPAGDERDRVAARIDEWETSTQLGIAGLLKLHLKPRPATPTRWCPKRCSCTSRRWARSRG